MVHTPAAITGDGSTHAFSATSQKANWVQVQADPNNSADSRVGDSNVSSTRGALVSANGFQFLPTGGNANLYDLSTLYYYLANGDKLYLTYNVF